MARARYAPLIRMRQRGKTLPCPLLRNAIKSGRRAQKAEHFRRQHELRSVRIEGMHMLVDDA